MPKSILTGILAATILLALILYGYTFLKTRSIEADYPPQGDFVSTASSEEDLHYVRGGSGVPVVLLHGRDGTLQEFTLSIFDDVADEYEAIAFDRPGYGYSEYDHPDQLTTKQQAKLIHEALNELEIEQPIIVGHSYGGAVMLQYLLDYPDQVRGGISLAGVSYMDEPPTEGFYALPRYPVIGPLITNTLVLPLGSIMAPNIYEQAFDPMEPPQKYIEEIASLYLRPKQFTATAYELSHMYDSVNAISEQYEEITTPVTILFGEMDRMLDYEKDGKRLQEALPNSKLRGIEEGGHKIHHSHPEIFLEELADLVDRTQD
ncbi:alpha/beta fold hydrolase [Isachenkonia alkalipeptolytica]|nr:alpha/beta hydrolase [Isachenkonia alkalipeptolytica]